MRVVAFIFARGGSKGLPNKNIKLLGKIPLVGHSILLARKLDFVSTVYVSTDSEEIASIARSLDAKIIKRPDDLANDTSPEWLAWQHAIKYVQEKDGSFDVFLSLPATSPLRTEGDVAKCFFSLSDDIDVVITATPSSANPYFNMICVNDDGTSSLILDNLKPYRRQDAPQVYDMTGVAYLSRPEFILNNDGIFSGKTKAVIIPKRRAIDIDDEEDFIFAKALYNKQS